MARRPATPTPPTPRPTPEQIDAAVRQEFHVQKPADWAVDAEMTFTIPGPVAVEVGTAVGQDIDSLLFSVEVGGLRLSVDWEGAEALAFSLLQQMYGHQWTRILMALCARCPVDYEDLGFEGLGDTVPDEAVQALWAAAYSYRERWPNRQGGFNDHIWGVPTPEGVEPTFSVSKVQP